LASGTSFGNITPHKLTSTQGGAPQSTIVQNWDTGRQGIGVLSQSPRKSVLSPMVLGAIALIGLLVLGGAGLGGAYMAGLIGGQQKDQGNTANTTPSPGSYPVAYTKPEMAEIPGGTFTMGRDDAEDPAERPEHQETVAPFLMDKTEVTNGEYYAFVKETGYKETPAHWENGKPVAGQENMPVRYVNVEDVNNFIKWRSARDKVQYRLPTEQEWEFAARNGNKKSLYPWGDRFRPECAVIDQDKNDPRAVGTASCPNDWGVQDLIGNVWEWTSSPPWLYPGNSGEIKPDKEQRFMIRGGSAIFKSTGKTGITSTTRNDRATATTRAAQLGFRLVRSQ
jgi:formylglycine-generating enzyme required for sulfatase activity